VDELDASIRRTGQVVGDYSYQHVSTLRLRLRLSASQHACFAGLSAFQPVVSMPRNERKTLLPLATAPLAHQGEAEP
jgi:hypothetical protein